MAHISQERLIEMEAEMDRFEQEIQAGEDLPKVIIGSSTYSQVSAQLKMLRAASGITPEQREKKHKEVAAQLRLLRARVERESSPPAEDLDLDSDKSRLVGRDDPPQNSLPIDASYLVPPPPPPPLLSGSAPSFIPHQLKHRPSLGPARPPGPQRMRPPPRFGGPMGPGPGMMHGPGGPGGMPPGPGPFPGPRFGPMGPGPMRPMGPMGPGPMGPGPMGGPRPPDMMGGSGMYAVSHGDEHNEQEKEEEIEDKPKVIYSSAPVINVQKPAKKKKKKKKKVDTGEEEPKGEQKSEQPADITEIETSTQAAPTSSSVRIPEPEDDFEVADMEIDNIVVPAKKEKKEKKKKFIRMAAGQTWEDQSLLEWDADDFRLFCGDLGNEVSDEVLARAFNKYPSFLKAKVVRDKRSNKTRGYGFVSFREPTDYVRAMREMNGKYVGNRPIKLRKSTWKDRSKDIVIKKEKEKKRLGLK